MSGRLLRLAILLTLLMTTCTALARAAGNGLPNAGELLYLYRRDTLSADWRLRLLDVARGLDVANPTPGVQFFGWSPDGRKILYIAQAAENITIYLLEDGRQRQLFHGVGQVSGSAPAWSPDGTRALYTLGHDTLTTLYLLDLTGETVTRRTLADGTDSYAPAWSPDGAQVAYISSQAGYQELRLVDAGCLESCKGRGLTRSDQYAVMPDWSPDSQQLAFVDQSRLIAQGMVVLKAAGGGQLRLSPGGVNWYPRWSPDGHTLAFQCSDGTTDWEICTLDLNTGRREQLTRGQGISTRPAWSPDGARIAFVSTRDGQPQVYVMNADGSDTRRLTWDPVGQSALPAWRP
jgi:Tol biopolymer transport system component